MQDAPWRGAGRASLRISQRSAASEAGRRRRARRCARRGAGRRRRSSGGLRSGSTGRSRVCVGGVVGEHEEQRLQRRLGLGEARAGRCRRARARRRTPRRRGLGPVTTSAASGSRVDPRARGAARRARARGRRRSVASRCPGSGAMVRSSAMVPWKATVPRFMIVTLSQISSTSSMSCELSSTVRPLPASRLTRARMSRMPAGSRPLAGSSRTSSRGSRSRLAATPSRCRIP